MQINKTDSCINQLASDWQPRVNSERRLQSKKTMSFSLTRTKSTEGLSSGRGTDSAGDWRAGKINKHECKNKITPPQLQQEQKNDDFLLSNFITDRLTSEQLRELGNKKLFEFSSQAILDLQYLDGLAENAIRRSDIIDKRLRKTYVDKLMNNRAVYQLMRIGLERCVSYFQDGNDSDNQSVKSETRGAMLGELRYNWCFLLKYMEQCREMMPAPATIPDMTTESDRLLTGLSDKLSFDNIKSAYSLLNTLQTQWTDLDCWLRALPKEVFVETGEQEHTVLLPINWRNLPPVSDIDDLIVAKSADPLQERRPQLVQSLVPKNAWRYLETSGVSQRERTCRADDSENNEQAKSSSVNKDGSGYVDDQSRHQSRKMSFENIPDICVSHVERCFLVDTKPENYFSYQPVMVELMQLICAKEKRQLRTAKTRLELLSMEKNEAGFSKDDKRTFKELVETLRDSSGFWNTEGLSLQTIYEQVHQAEMEKAASQAKAFSGKGLKVAIKKMYQKLSSRKRSNSFHTRGGRTQPVMVPKYNSLRERPAISVTVRAPDLIFTPPTPINSDHSESSGNVSPVCSDVE